MADLKDSDLEAKDNSKWDNSLVWALLTIFGNSTRTITRVQILLAVSFVAVCLHVVFSFHFNFRVTLYKFIVLSFPKRTSSQHQKKRASACREILREPGYF